MDINKAALVKQLMKKHNYTKKAATAVVDDFTDIILCNLEQGNSVSLKNFGCFDLVERAQRSCPDPQTRETIVIPAHWIPRFFPSQRMRGAVKIWEDEQKRGLNGQNRGLN